MHKFHISLITYNLLTNSTGVGRQSLSRRSVSITHNQDVVKSISTRAEGILEDTARPQDNLRVITRSLISRRSIEVPTGELINSLGTGNGKSTCLGTAFSLGVNPNVFSEDLVVRVGKSVETVNDGGVELGLTGFEVELLDHVEGRGAGNSVGGGGEGGGSADGSEEGNSKLHG